MFKLMGASGKAHGPGRQPIHQSGRHGFAVCIFPDDIGFAIAIYIPHLLNLPVARFLIKQRTISCCNSTTFVLLVNILKESGMGLQGTPD